MSRARVGFGVRGAGCAWAGGAWLCCAAAMAQAPGRADGAGGGVEIRRIEAGTADRDPARTSLRSLQRDLRVPTGFESVYQIDRADAFGVRETSFMRIDGNLHAVFPRSVYVPTSRGSAAVVPPGTTFFIGLPPHPPTPARTALRREGFVDLSLPLRTVMRGVDGAGSAAQSSGLQDGSAAWVRSARERGSVQGKEGGKAPLVMSLFENEAYYGYRVADLLLRARAAEKRGEGAPARGPDPADGAATDGATPRRPGPSR